VNDLSGRDAGRAAARAGSPLARRPFSILLALATIAMLAPGAPAQDRSPEAPALASLPDALQRTYAAIPADGVPRNVADLKAIERHVQALIDRALPAIASVAGASAVVVKDGLVLTAGHVIRTFGRSGRNRQITLHDGREIAITPLGRNDRVDAGLLRLEAGDDDAVPAVDMGRSGRLRPGAWCLMFGHPGGPRRWRPASVRLGRLLELRDDGSMVTDCPMQSGDSGGPLLDLTGRVVGINSRITSDLRTNIHVQIDAFRDHWDALLAGDRVRGGWGMLRDADRAAPSRYSTEIRRAFRPVVARVRESTVEVHSDGKRVALGAVVRADGLVVTKASQLGEEIACVVGRSRVRLPARRVATDDVNDLALIAVDGVELTPVRWTGDLSIKPGTWLVTPDLGDLPASFGIASVPIHSRPLTGYLGVRLRIRKAKVELRSTEKGSPAEVAGLARGDVIVALDGEPMPRGRVWRRALSRREPGEQVRLVVRRGEREFPVTIKLAAPKNRTGARSRQRGLWGPLSDVRAGFSRVLQHDSVLEPELCGGPLVNLDGDAVGINIARAGRVETLALPADTVRAAVRDLLAKARASDAR